MWLSVCLSVRLCMDVNQLHAKVADAVVQADADPVS